MKIHLIGSAYMKNDGMPCLMVSYKQYNNLSKKSGESFELEFYGVGSTAEEAEGNIFESFGLGKEASPALKLKTVEAKLSIAVWALTKMEKDWDDKFLTPTGMALIAKDALAKIAALSEEKKE